MREFLREQAVRETILSLVHVSAALIVANVIYGHDIIYLFSPLTDIALGGLRQSYVYGPLAALIMGALVWLLRDDFNAHAGFAAAASIIAVMPPIIRDIVMQTTVLAQQRFGGMVEVQQTGQSPWLLGPLVFIGFIIVPAIIQWRRAKRKEAVVRTISVSFVLTMLGIAAAHLLGAIVLQFLILPQIA